MLSEEKKQKKFPVKGRKKSKRRKFPIKDREKEKKKKIPDQRSEENRRSKNEIVIRSRKRKIALCEQ